MPRNKMNHPVTIVFTTSPIPWYDELKNQWSVTEHEEFMAMAAFEEEVSAGRCGLIRLVETEERWRKARDGKCRRYSKKGENVSTKLVRTV